MSPTAAVAELSTFEILRQVIEKALELGKLGDADRLLAAAVRHYEGSLERLVTPEGRAAATGARSRLLSLLERLDALTGGQREQRFRSRFS